MTDVLDPAYPYLLMVHGHEVDDGTFEELLPVADHLALRDIPFRLIPDIDDGDEGELVEVDR